MKPKFLLFFLALVLLSYAPTYSQSAADHFKSAMAASRANDLNLAIVEYSAVIQLEPANSMAYYNRGIIYQKLQNTGLAILDYSKAISLKPDYVSAYINRGNVYDTIKNVDLAIADYSKAIQLSPRNANAYFNRAVAYKLQNRLAESLADYDRSIEIDPNVAKAYAQRGNVHASLTNWTASIADFDRAVAMEPVAYKSLYYGLAWMNLNVGRDAAAYTAATKSLEGEGIKSTRAGYSLVVGYLALLRQGKRAEAEAFIARYPRNEIAGVMPAKSVEFLRGELKAEDLLAEAGNDKQKLTDAHSTIGARLLLDGKTDAARDHFKWVVTNGIKGPAAYALATAELAKLDSK